jgi:hypothetical protein
MPLEPALRGSANQLNERSVLTIRFGAVNGGKVSESCRSRVRFGYGSYRQVFGRSRRKLGIIEAAIRF